jgi:hypothetical protein
MVWREEDHVWAPLPPKDPMEMCAVWINGLPQQDIQCPATNFQCLRRMVVGNASMGLCLPGVASIMKQGRLPMVLDSFFQLDGGFKMKELRSHYGFW